MTFDPDDPRFTAYALGELENDERAAVEALLTQNDAARRLVDEVRSLAHLLSDQLKAEPGPALLPAQRDLIEAKAKAPVVATLSGWSRVLRYGVAAGALTFVAGSSYIIWQQSRPQARVDLLRSQPTGENNVEIASPADESRARGEAEQAGGAEGIVGMQRRAFAMDGAEAPVVAAREPAQPPESSLEMNLPAPSPAMPAPGQAAPSNGQVAGYVAYDAPAKDAAPVNLYKEQFGQSTLSLKTEAAPAAGGMRGAMGSMMGDAKAADPNAAGLGAGLGGRMGRGDTAGASAPTDARAFAKLAEGDKGNKAKELADNYSLQVPGLQEAEKLAAGVEVRLHDALGEEIKQAGKPIDEANALSTLEAARQVDEKRSEALGRIAQEAKSNPVAAFRFKQAAPLGQANTEQYAAINENAPTAVTPNNTLSTFAVDVDTASYTNMRRFLMQENTLPPPDAIRLEELINYFSYDYPEPSGDAPFSVDSEVTRCPWNADHKLLRIGLKGRSVAFENRQPANLVFLVDASGSMDEPLKTPLVKAGLRMLVEQLGENDKVSIVTYASGSGVALPPTTGHRKPEILAAIDAIQPGGSTNGAAGINTAYELAKQNFIKGGLNRVILATDGDFNVGVTDVGSLTRMAEENAKSGVFLNVLGFGDGNLKDQTMEQIADHGNGQYGYIDSLLEARKTFVEQIGGTLVTIAKDVKIQVDFNPAKVGAYRQVGYENRAMAAQDFRNDAKDAGEIGSGHTVTALYELIPPSDEAKALAEKVPDSKYVRQGNLTEDAKSNDELLTVFLRYKQPDGDKATEIQHAVKDDVKDLGKASTDTKFAASVALFGMQLRGSKHIPAESSLDATLEMAEANRGRDPGGYRAEFVELIKKAKTIVTP